MGRKNTVTNGDLFNIVEVLNNVVSLPVTDGRGMSLSLAFRALAREIEPITKDLNELRAGFITEFAEKDDDGKPEIDSEDKIVFVDGGQEKFYAAMSEMMQKTVSISHPISEDKLIEGAEWLSGAFSGGNGAFFLSVIYPFCFQ
jgi:hypothetical protein